MNYLVSYYMLLQGQEQPDEWVVRVDARNREEAIQRALKIKIGNVGEESLKFMGSAIRVHEDAFGEALERAELRLEQERNMNKLYKKRVDDLEAVVTRIKNALRGDRE